MRLLCLVIAIYLLVNYVIWHEFLGYVDELLHLLLCLWQFYCVTGFSLVHVVCCGVE